MSTIKIRFFFLAVALVIFAQIAATQGSRVEGGKGGMEGPSIWTEDQAIYWLKKDIGFVESGGAPERVIDAIAWTSRTLKALSNPEKLVRFIVDFPTNDDGIRATKINVLIPYKSYPGVRDLVYSAALIEEPSTQESAARALLQWGDWEMAFPLIKKWECYSVFWTISRDENNLKDKALPFLEDAIKTGSWEGRINAAYGFLAYGDSTKVQEVSADIIKRCPLSDDKSNIRAQYAALTNARRFKIALITEIGKMADSPSQGIRILSVDVLGNFSNNGYGTARRMLKKIANENPDLKLRATAQGYLDN